MNFYASTATTFAPDRVSVRVAAGIAISIALHGALLFAYRRGALPSWEPPAAPREALVVTLRASDPVPLPEPVAKPVPAPRPKPLPEPEAEPATTPLPVRSAQKQAAKAKQPQRPAASTPEVIALPDNGASEPDAFTVAPPSTAPRFDPEAARKLARAMANEPDPARAGTAVAQIPPKPYATETKAAQLIAGAKRRDCKDGVPGGLLAPIFLMLDKKDSGCKW